LGIVIHTGDTTTPATHDRPRKPNQDFCDRDWRSVKTLRNWEQRRRRPPLRHYSRQPRIVGSRAPSAKVLMRIGLVVTSGSRQTYMPPRPLTYRAEPTDQPAQPAQPT
jgi:hypothetical protein